MSKWKKLLYRRGGRPGTRLRRCCAEQLDPRHLLAGNPFAHWVADDLQGVHQDGEQIAAWVDSAGGVVAEASGAPKFAQDQYEGHAAVRFDRFDGVDAFLIPAAHSPLSGAGDFSIVLAFATQNQSLNGGTQAWFLNTGLVDGTDFFGLTADWGLVINSAGQIGAGMGKPATSLYTMEQNLNDGGVHVAVFTRAAGTMTLSVDGRDPVTTETAGADPRIAVDMTIGAVSGDTFAFTGDLLEIQVFDNRLSSGDTVDLSLELLQKYGEVPPRAFDDTYVVAEDGVLTVDAAGGVLADDFSVDVVPLTARLLEQPHHGRLVLNSDGSFVYHPDADFTGTDTFLYLASNSADSNVATVTIEVTPSYDSPQARGDTYLVQAGEPFVATTARGVLANDRNVDNATITAALWQDVQHGALLFRSDGSFEYTPQPGFLGTDRFTYRVGDGISEPDAAAVELNITDEPALIAEFMAAGGDALTTRTRRTAEQAFSGPGLELDWIEIQNLSRLPLDLGGAYLTDDRNQPTKWQIPAGTIVPGAETLVFFASGQDIRDPALDEHGFLHTNFGLAEEGEYLALVGAAGNVRREFAPAYPPQIENVSYGVSTLGGVPAYFSEFTPGVANGYGESAVLQAPTFSVAGGAFQGSLTVALSSQSPSDIIRLTTDGSVPDRSSTQYSGPVQISASVQLRARAFREGFVPSLVSTESYVQLAADVLSFSSNLPLLVIESFGHRIVENTSVAVTLFEPNQAGRSRLTDVDTLQSRAAMSVRGSSSAGFSKTPYALEFRQEGSESDRSVELLGLPADSDWVLYGPFEFDRSYTRNPLIFDISNQLGRYAPRTRYVEVFLNVDDGHVSRTDDPLTTLIEDDYRGIYVLMEKIKRSADRVDIEELTASHKSAEEISGGYILKIDRADPSDDGFAVRRIGPGTTQIMRYVDPKEVEIETRPDQVNWLTQYINDFVTALAEPDFRHPETGQHYSEWIDVSSWVDHHLINEIALNVDALRLSAYFYKPRGGKLAAGPIWDLDRSMESDDSRDDNPRSWYFDVQSAPNWWDRLFEDLEFRQAYIDRYAEGRRDTLTTENVYATVEKLAGQLNEASQRDVERWPQVGPRSTARFDSEKLDGTWRGEIEHQKAWLAERLAWLDSLFLPAPEAAITLDGSTSLLTMTAPAGATIYFTTDGSDPRLVGGGISPAALKYTGPMPLADNLILRARSYDPSYNVPISSFNLADKDPSQDAEAWSGLSSQSLSVGATPQEALRISEIQYHAAPPSAAELLAGFSDDRDFDFVELVNTSDYTLDLQHVQLARMAVGAGLQGVEFEFANADVQRLRPGERVLVVENLAAFRFRYGDGPNVAGSWQGGLSNNRELLTLSNGSHLIQQFSYDDDWHPATDGRGASLEIIDAAAANLAVWNSAAGWRPSAIVGGTPGTGDDLQLVRGDFNSDRAVDQADIDRLQSQVDVGLHPLALDLDGNGRVNRADVDELVLNVLRTVYGDANLDGVVTAGGTGLPGDGETLLGNLGQGTGRGWADGDFSGDGEVTASRDGALLLAALGANLSSR